MSWRNEPTYSLPPGLDAVHVAAVASSPSTKPPYEQQMFTFTHGFVSPCGHGRDRLLDPNRLHSLLFLHEAEKYGTIRGGEVFAPAAPDLTGGRPIGLRDLMQRAFHYGDNWPMSRSFYVYENVEFLKRVIEALFLSLSLIHI